MCGTPEAVRHLKDMCSWLVVRRSPKDPCVVCAGVCVCVSALQCLYMSSIFLPPFGIIVRCDCFEDDAASCRNVLEPLRLERRFGGEHSRLDVRCYCFDHDVSRRCAIQSFSCKPMESFRAVGATDDRFGAGIPGLAFVVIAMKMMLLLELFH